MRRPPTRRDRIHAELDRARELGSITYWYAYGPGDRRGTRYVIELPGGVTKSLVIREVEAFLIGISAGRGAR